MKILLAIAFIQSLNLAVLAWLNHLTWMLNLKLRQQPAVDEGTETHPGFLLPLQS